MSLFSALQVSSNALKVNQLGLQIVSNNIANANTPGYIRQEFVQAAGPSYRFGESFLGQGVKPVGVQQRVDEFLLQSMRNAQSKLAHGERLDEVNSQLEATLAELGDGDLSSSMSRFSNAMQDVANQPGNFAMRSLAIQRGKELAEGLRSLSAKVLEVRNNADGAIPSITDRINHLTAEIADLNQKIVEVEGGSISNSDAVGLRDERIKVLDELSTLINVQAVEQDTGAVMVYVGGDYLVTDSIQRPLRTAVIENKENGFNRYEVQLVDTDSPLEVTGGELKGQYDARDSASATFFQRLDHLTQQIIRQVNRVHSQGQGTTGLSEAIGEPLLDDLDAPIEQAGSRLQIDNGSFFIHLHDTASGATKAHEIRIRQQGDANDTTVDGLLQQLNQINGLQASVSEDGRFQIRAASSGTRFSFSQDTSGVLASLGINTFFSGTSANTIRVRDDLAKDPGRLAISLDGPGRGNGNAIALAEAFDQADAALDGQSLRENYEGLLSVTTQEINAQRAITDGTRGFYQTLEARHLGMTGVNLDEEGVRMLMYQRAFQASSRLIAVTSELLDTLVNIV
jgi:flagellar hook-associated protein 1 FlgK